MPFVNVKTPQQALEFIQAADHPAGGVLLDIWHIARAGLRSQVGRLGAGPLDHGC